MLMSAPNGGKVEGNFTAQELDSIMKNHENKFMKVSHNSYYVIISLMMSICTKAFSLKASEEF